MANHDINAIAEIHEEKLRAHAQNRIKSQNQYSVTPFFTSGMFGLMIISLQKYQPKINWARTLAILGITMMLVALTVIAYLIYSEYDSISPDLITRVISTLILSLCFNTLLKSLSRCLLNKLKLDLKNSKNKIILESFILGIPTYEKIIR